MSSVRLISIQTPAPGIIEELGVDSPEGLTAYIARVSNPKNQSNEKVNGLISYCVKHGHFSILEHVNMTLEITTTRDISAQIIRHRSFTFQELSQRYQSTSVLSAPYEYPEFRGQHKKNRQLSEDILEHDTLTKKIVFTILKPLAYFLMDINYKVYKALLWTGVAKECARRILPLSSGTKIYMTGNIRSFLHYIEARTYSGAQKEHRMVAQDIKEIFVSLFPNIDIKPAS